MLRLPHTGVTPDMLGEIQSLLGVVGLDKARADLDLTEVPAEVARYIVSVVRRTRENPGLELGASSRAAIHLLSASKAQARLGRPGLRHGRRRPRRRTVRAAPPPHLPCRARQRTTPSRRHSTDRRPCRGARTHPEPGHRRSGERLDQRPLRQHPGEMHPELRRGRGVARRLGALGGVGRRVGRRGAARHGLLDRRGPERRPTHVRRARRRPPSAGRCPGARARRHPPSPSPARAGGTSGTTSRSSRRASGPGSP